MSRSLVTIAAAILAGLSLPAPVKFSYLLGLATVGAASVYELSMAGSLVVDAFGWGASLLGLAAALSAAAAVRWLVAFVGSHDLRPYGWYRLGIGIVTPALIGARTL